MPSQMKASHLAPVVGMAWLACLRFSSLTPFQVVGFNPGVNGGRVGLALLLLLHLFENALAFALVAQTDNLVVIAQTGHMM